MINYICIMHKAPEWNHPPAYSSQRYVLLPRRQLPVEANLEPVSAIKAGRVWSERSPVASVALWPLSGSSFLDQSLKSLPAGFPGQIPRFPRHQDQPFIIPSQPLWTPTHTAVFDLCCPAVIAVGAH